MRAGLGVAAAVAMLAAAPAAQAGDKAWQDVADVGVVSLTLAALGGSALDRDGEGVKEFAQAEGATAASVWGLKHTFPETRPNGRNRQSFPSGHTAVSFAAAGYLQERYGWQVGLPATAAAALVGLARVESHDHHWYDVAVGAAIGEGWAWLTTDPKNDQVKVFPWADSHGAGLSLAARF